MLSFMIHTLINLKNFRSLDFLKRKEEFDSIVLSVPHDENKK